MRHKPVAKLSRSIGMPLTPKAVKYFERRPFPPGQRRQQTRTGPYKERLLEKQKLRFQYHVSEKQMQRAYEDAHRRPEPTGEALIEDLESRLDATVLRAGLARTIYQARQFVSHGHILVDGKRIDRPAYRLTEGQTLAIREKSRSIPWFESLAILPEQESPPAYLQVDRKALTCVLIRRARRSEIPVICNEQLVVEYYAR